jgi:1-aminocyclopropane-1-carboxylate deaminase/D-cysteine desulfhydrase-like pyridoxal-dependent ACC family enzyme
MKRIDGADWEQAVAGWRAIPRLSLSHPMTPLEEAPRLRAALGGGPRILLKRDDYLGAGFGGNKVRKLEYLLAEARREGVEVVITCGGEKSNHARVTAALCARLGMGCRLVLNPPALGYRGWAPASLLADRLYGAEIDRVPDREARDRRMAELAEQERARGRKSCVIPLGASVPLGAVGLVSAAAEVESQLATQGIEVDALFHCSSSGGTQAGLVLGAALYPRTARQVIGVSPDGGAAEIEATVRAILDGAQELLGVSREASHWELRVDDRYRGEGYGIPSPEGQVALELLARTEGILLDPVYTAKAMAGMIAWIREGQFREDQTVLFWHTGGQLALFYAPEEESGGGRPR